MINLSKISTDAPKGLEKDDVKDEVKRRCKRIGELQEMMYAQGKYNLLVIFQGMDASGKDGATRSTFEYCSPAGVKVFPFKKPSDEEFAHDFLWRIHQHTPPKGMIHVFNRSHYEDVLIQRVHGWIDEERVDRRINAINAFEELLQYDNYTQVLKFYLHISKEQQYEELMERKVEPDKFWKHNDGDWKERERWDDYRRCYEDVINRSTIPWHIIPVDQRWYRDYLISQIILERLEELPLAYPGLEEG